MEAEKTVSAYKTTECHNTADYSLNSRRENLETSRYVTACYIPSYWTFSSKLFLVLN
jgi:hypothetical protein